MERIHARALETENRVRMLETHGLRLQAQQTMLTNISTQATLLLGFALATYGADLLPYILNDDSPFCLYKNEASMFVGFIFLLSNTCCVCFCMMVLIASSLLVIQSQNAYLLVGGEVAVWRTQQLSSTVFYWYGLALLCFLLDAVLLGWIFLGFPHWLPNPNPGLNSEDVMTTDGQELLRCIDPTDPLAHARRDTFGSWNAAVSTLFFISFVIYGVSKMRGFVHLYTLDELRGGDEVVREEQRKSRERDLRREVDLAKMRLSDAQYNLKEVERAADSDPREVGKKKTDLEKAKRKLQIANHNLQEFKRQNVRGNGKGAFSQRSALTTLRFIAKLRPRRRTNADTRVLKDAAAPIRPAGGGLIGMLGSAAASAPSAQVSERPPAAAKPGLNLATKTVTAMSPRARVLGDPTGPQDDEMDSTA